MTKKSDPVEELKSPPLSLEKAEKGSHRSMWELLLQLRVLLPYLARLVPLLDHALVKPGPDLSELTQGIAGIQTAAATWKCRPGTRRSNWSESSSKWAVCEWFTRTALRKAADFMPIYDPSAAG